MLYCYLSETTVMPVTNSSPAGCNQDWGKACGKYRSSCPEVFCKKGALRNFAKFKGKHLCHWWLLLKVVWSIRKNYPSENVVYTEFKQAENGQDLQDLRDQGRLSGLKSFLFSGKFVTSNITQITLYQ